MKISGWSVIPTADGLGVALMADGCSTEVCIRVVGDQYEVRAYGDNVEPIAKLSFSAGDDKP